MKKFLVLAMLLLAFGLRAEDGTCQLVDTSEATTATPVEVEEHHGFFHPLTHAFGHTVGHGMKKGAGSVHDGIGGKSEPKEKINIKADAEAQDQARENSQEASKILKDIDEINKEIDRAVKEPEDAQKIKVYAKVYVDFAVKKIMEFDVKKLVGMSKDDGVALIAQAGLKSRILREDKSTFIGTAETDLYRINIEIDAGKITSAKDEIPERLKAPPAK